ncbi:MAG: AraC family transcriptional regulator [Syntrophomonadaceae bacterium]
MIITSYGKDSSVEKSLQSAFIENEQYLFQLVDLFPLPIEIFAPDGTTVFGNRAALEMCNVMGLDQVVGVYNILEDPVVNDILGLREYVSRAFKGETLSVSDVRVPLEDMAGRYETREDDPPINSLYNDIISFPIWGGNNAIAYIVNIFITTRIYQGQTEVTKAKEYIEEHWIEKFNLDELARFVNLSKYHFSHLFKKHTGTTPYSYYQDIKVEKLKETLRDKNLSVSEAFDACGLHYNGHQAQLFKKRTGLTPSEYRRAEI